MTYDDTRLTRLGKEHRRIKTALDRIRAELADEIPKAAEGGMAQHEIAGKAGYTREIVRQLCLTPEQREEERIKRRARRSST